MYCIGKKDWKGQPGTVPPEPAEPAPAQSRMISLWR
jgi:hypothetical protein